MLPLASRTRASKAIFKLASAPAANKRALSDTAAVEPVFNVCAEPPDQPATKLLFLGESPDERKSGENPVMSPREPRYIARGEDLIPGRKSFVNPTREGDIRHSRIRVIHRPPSIVVDIHGACCSMCGSGSSGTSCHSGASIGTWRDGGNDENRRLFGEYSCDQLGNTPTCRLKALGRSISAE